VLTIKDVTGRLKLEGWTYMKLHSIWGSTPLVKHKYYWTLYGGDGWL
jgi:hypothetical protein